LRGKDIPLAARLVAVADAFDEIRAPMPAGDPIATDSAMNDLRRLAKDRLDPDVLAAFVKAYRDGRLVV
jgi:HD-GYP domain-containing protein (c-di-GMP phosphodiesterase class II)